MQKNRKPSPVVSTTLNDRKSPSLSKKTNTFAFNNKPPTPTGQRQTSLARSPSSAVQNDLRGLGKPRKASSNVSDNSQDFQSLSLFGNQLLSESERYGAFNDGKAFDQEFKTDWVLQDIVHQQQQGECAEGGLRSGVSSSQPSPHLPGSATPGTPHNAISTPTSDHPKAASGGIANNEFESDDDADICDCTFDDDSHFGSQGEIDKGAFLESLSRQNVNAHSHNTSLDGHIDNWPDLTGKTSEIATPRPINPATNTSTHTSSSYHQTFVPSISNSALSTAPGSYNNSNNSSFFVPSSDKAMSAVCSSKDKEVGAVGTPNSSEAGHRISSVSPYASEHGSVCPSTRESECANPESMSHWEGEGRYTPRALNPGSFPAPVPGVSQTPTMLLPPPPEFHVHPETYYLQLIALCQEELRNRNTRASHNLPASIHGSSVNSIDTYSPNTSIDCVSLGYAVSAMASSPNSSGIDMHNDSFHNPDVTRDVKHSESHYYDNVRTGKRRAKSGSFTVNSNHGIASGTTSGTNTSIGTPIGAPSPSASAPLGSPLNTSISSAGKSPSRHVPHVNAKRPQSGGPNRPISKDGHPHNLHNQMPHTGPKESVANATRNFHNEVEDPELFKILGNAASFPTQVKATHSSKEYQSHVSTSRSGSTHARSEKPVEKMFVTSMMVDHFPYAIPHSSTLHHRSSNLPKRVQPLRPDICKHPVLPKVVLKRNDSDGSLSGSGLRSPLSAFDDCSVGSDRSISSIYSKGSMSGSTTTSMSTQGTQNTQTSMLFNAYKQLSSAISGR